jgi:5'-nucleotidase
MGNIMSKKKQKLIFITNDDGYSAPGLKSLISALSPLGKIVVVAPDSERSASGHSLSLYQPLRLDLREESPGIEIYSCNGTPTDCVSLAIHFLLKEKPDIIVTGINAGGNLGDDITYSGTVMAAMEGASQGILSVAVSLVTNRPEADYSAAAEFASLFVNCVMGFPVPEIVFFSINVPDIPRDELKGAMVTIQGRSFYKQKIDERIDPWGRKYYWVTGLRASGKIEPGTDFYALEQKKISVTPLKLTMSNEEFVRELQKWDIFHEPLPFITPGQFSEQKSNTQLSDKPSLTS